MIVRSKCEQIHARFEDDATSLPGGGGEIFWPINQSFRSISPRHARSDRAKILAATSLRFASIARLSRHRSLHFTFWNLYTDYAFKKGTLLFHK